jgi:hypothetical protein
VNDAGLMILPPVCVPSARGTWKAATAAAEPEEEPPGVWRALCGFVVLGPRVEMANSVVVVLPRGRAPSWERTTREGASCVFGGDGKRGEL